MNARRRFFVLARSLLAMALLAGMLHGSIQPAHAATQTDIHGPAYSGSFGARVAVLPNGNFVVTDPSYNGGIGVDAGAVYLYNGATGAMISMLTGSNANNQVGSGGVTVLSNGNYVVRSPYWDNGGTADVGAVTWGSRTGGVSGAVSPSNSLVGSTANDQVGSWGVTPLSNGNYVVASRSWDAFGAVNAGAVTWGNGNGGTAGAVSELNSLVGSSADDMVGFDWVHALSNGNYVVRSRDWDAVGAVNAGAVTWGNGAGGTVGLVTAANSLVGSTANDQIGNQVIELSNGHYVVRSPAWDNGGTADAGAVTWANGASGIAGEISDANSLVGNKAGDFVGNASVVALSNGNYVAVSYLWNNGAVPDAGAVTWGNGNTGTPGVVSAGNSLVGATAGDQIGSHGVTALSNGHYVVGSPYWDDGGMADVGAATWGNGNGGTAGAISDANSLVGSTAGDQVGFFLTALSDGDYVVSSFFWDNGGVMDVGAATWGNGAAGITGPVTTINSLVGSTADDQVGSRGATPLSNGDYVVRSPGWDNGGATNAGAVTWGDGTGGISGVVSTSNSLVGSTANDSIGSYYVTALSTGDYVAPNPEWDNTGAVNAGAVTWGNGNGGTVGPISAGNSLVGEAAYDYVGDGLIALSDGDYLVRSPYWDAVGVSNAGAVTWGSGDGGIHGPVSDLNSLVGETASDQVGSGVWTPLDDGSYVVHSSFWDNGAMADAGAVSWGFGPGGMVGPITAANSVLGAAAGGGWAMTFAYDPVNHQLVVGRPADNIVTLFKLVYGVSLTPPTAAKTGLPGATVSYTLQVTNNGDTTESFNLSAGGNSWTASLPATVGPLDPGASASVTVTVTVPAAAAGGAADVATITAASQASPAKKDTTALTTTASNVYGVTVTPPTAAQTGQPGATVSYTVAITNTGNTADSFSLAAGGHAWTTSITPATVGPLAAGASQNVTVDVTVPASAAGGSTDAVTITVTSQSDGTKTDTAVLTTTAGNVYGVTVTPPTAAKSGAPGATVSYTVAIANTGNTAASFTLAAGGHAWTTSFPATVGPLAAGAVQNVTVTVTVPASAAGGSTDAVTITVTSQSDGTVTDTAVLTTTADNRKIYMPVVRK